MDSTIDAFTPARGICSAAEQLLQALLGLAYGLLGAPQAFRQTSRRGLQSLGFAKCSVRFPNRISLLRTKLAHFGAGVL